MEHTERLLRCLVNSSASNDPPHTHTHKTTHHCRWCCPRDPWIYRRFAATVSQHRESTPRFTTSCVQFLNCAKSLQGEAPCGSAVYGKVDEMSPPPPPGPPAWTPPPPDKEDKEESTTLPTPQGTSHCSCLEHCFLFYEEEQTIFLQVNENCIACKNSTMAVFDLHAAGRRRGGATSPRVGVK